MSVQSTYHQPLAIKPRTLAKTQQPAHVKAINLKALTVHDDIGEMRMLDAYHRFVIDEQAAIPLSIKLLENPKSPIAFPGSISLRGHDYLHLLLNRGVTLFDEGFVVGFTMGNCDQLRPHHISLYKLFSKTFFPKTYKFKDIHFKAFDLGIMYGQKLPTQNIHRVDFDQYAHQTISDVRRIFGIDLKQIQMLWEKERLLLDSNA